MKRSFAQRQPLPAASSHRSDGFTLIELLVSLAIGSILLIAVLNLFDLNSRVGRVQTDLAEVQQSQRVVHNLIGDEIRMTGRGGLALPFAVNVADNVAADFQVAGNETVDGSDVLRLRGVFESLWLVDVENATTFTYDDTTDVGTVTVDSLMPSAIGFQPLDVLEEFDTNNTRVAMILVSAQNSNTYAVVELDTTATTIVGTDINGDGTTETWEKRASIRFSGDPTETANNGSFMALSSTPGAWPDLTRVSMIGVLQEFHYYVRDTDLAAQGNRPKLSRAEFFPNTTTVRGGAANGRVDLADFVADFQVARAFDLDGDSIIDEDYEDPEDDEWLGNHPDDAGPTAGADGYATPAAHALVGWNMNAVTHVAISTMIETARTDPQYLSPPMVRFENHALNEMAVPVSDEELIQRRHRRRIFRTVLDMRNL